MNQNWAKRIIKIENFNKFLEFMFFHINKSCMFELLSYYFNFFLGRIQRFQRERAWVTNTVIALFDSRKKCFYDGENQRSLALLGKK